MSRPAEVDVGAVSGILDMGEKQGALVLRACLTDTDTPQSWPELWWRGGPDITVFYDMIPTSPSLNGSAVHFNRPGVK
jgi:hypothetical protein